MTTALESRAALSLVTDAAVADAVRVLQSSSGSPGSRRSLMLDVTPELVGMYGEGSAALAADFYEDAREAAGVSSRFVAAAVVADRTVRVRRATAWASEPLFDGADDVAAARFAEVVQYEVARPYRETVLANRREDPDAVGWRRVTSGAGCNFCAMLAGRGAVYRRTTVHFATHEHCHCTAEPVFGSFRGFVEASEMQYLASRRNRTKRQQAALREFLAGYAA